MTTTTKRLKIKVDSFYKYIQIFNGIFRMTETEMRVLEGFLKRRHSIMMNRQTNDEPDVFGKEGKEYVAKLINRKDPNTLNNNIKSLKDKGAIYPINGQKRGYYINRMLIPTGKHEEIRIIINENS